MIVFFFFLSLFIFCNRLVRCDNKNWYDNCWLLTFNLRLALNFFKQSTVSCLWTTEATRSRCCEGKKMKKIYNKFLCFFVYSKKKYAIFTQIHGCLRASFAVILLLGFTVSIWLMRFFASGVTVSHSGVGYCFTKKKKKTYYLYICFFESSNVTLNN